MPVENWSETVAVVHLCDEPQFTEDMESLDKALKQRRRHVLLDLAAVHYVNSSNIAQLLRLRKEMITNSRRLVLCGLITPVWGAFLVTGLDKIFEFGDDVPTGLAMLQLLGNGK
jgi:anti-anti-sigma factor